MALDLAGLRALGRKATTGLGLGALAYGGYKGLQAGAEQDTRIEDLMNARTHDMTAQLPSMTVTASYEEFAARKLAERGVLPAMPVLPTMGSAASHALATSLTNSLVSKPLDALGGVLHKKLYEEPKHRATYDAAVAGDPELTGADPKMLAGAFSTMKRFGPTLATDPNATRNFLRQAMMAGGNLDYATIRMLAETEKFIQQAKGKGTPG